MGQAVEGLENVAPAVAIALANAIGKATKDHDLAPGTYPIDATVTVRVQGAVTRSPDTTENPAVRVPMVELLAAALEHAGLSRKKAREAITLALPEVLAGYTPKNTDRLTDAQSAIEEFQESVKATQEHKAKRGPTKVNVTLAITGDGVKAVA